MYAIFDHFGVLIHLHPRNGVIQNISIFGTDPKCINNLSQPNQRCFFFLKTHVEYLRNKKKLVKKMVNLHLVLHCYLASFFSKLTIQQSQTYLLQCNKDLKINNLLSWPYFDMFTGGKCLFSKIYIKIDRCLDWKLTLACYMILLNDSQFLEWPPHPDWLGLGKYCAAPHIWNIYVLPSYKWSLVLRKS